MTVVTFTRICIWAMLSMAGLLVALVCGMAEIRATFAVPLFYILLALFWVLTGYWYGLRIEERQDCQVRITRTVGLARVGALVDARLTLSVSRSGMTVLVDVPSTDICSIKCLAAIMSMRTARGWRWQLF